MNYQIDPENAPPEQRARYLTFREPPSAWEGTNYPCSQEDIDMCENLLDPNPADQANPEEALRALVRCNSPRRQDFSQDESDAMDRIVEFIRSEKD